MNNSAKTAPTAALPKKQPSFAILSFVGVYTILSSLVSPLLSDFSGSYLLSYLIILVVMGFGYFLQAAFCASLGFRRETGTRTYESDVKFYNFKRALPIIIVGIVLSFFVRSGVDFYLKERSNQLGFSYDPNSAVPLIAMAVFVFVMAAGSFVWFFPYDRIMTGKAFLVGVVIFGSLFALYSTGGSAYTGVIAINFIVYSFCALICTNQYAIGKTYRGTVVSFMTGKTRLYNFALSMLLVGVFLALLFGFYLIVNGLRVIFLFLLATFLSAIYNDNAGYTEEEEIETGVGNLSEFLFATTDVKSAPDYWYFIIFVVLSLVFLGFMLVKRAPEVRRFLTWLKNSILSFFEMIFRPIADFCAPSERGFVNFVDEEERMQKEEVQARVRLRAEETFTLKDFYARLRAIRTPEDRYRYAYRTFVGRMRRIPAFVKKSDTPRRICEKIVESGRVTESETIKAISEEFERIEFADGGADGKTDSALESLCEIIKENT